VFRYLQSRWYKNHKPHLRLHRRKKLLLFFPHKIIITILTRFVLYCFPVFSLLYICVDKQSFVHLPLLLSFSCNINNNNIYRPFWCWRSDNTNKSIIWWLKCFQYIELRRRMYRNKIHIQTLTGSLFLRFINLAQLFLSKFP